MQGPLGYRDVSLIGVGATSRVYRATQAVGGRVVALKRLHRQLVQSADALARMRRELEALGKLEHPAIVRFHDVVRWEGDPTLVMEHVPGDDLQALIERQGMLPVAEVERIARALFAALSAVHAGGIVHRDLKPQNVRVREDGQVVVLDFGSARLDAASQLTRTGSTVGTPEYMPPELFVGPAYDPRSDVYGAGATLFACATGRAPHAADTLAELAFLRSEVPAPPVRTLRPEVPEALAQVIDRCLAIRPEDRFPTAALAAWALDHGEEERLLAARRSRLPLCVHCGAACAPEATRCARCGSQSPFRYDAGAHHVVIESAASTEKLARWIVDQVPERAAPEALVRTCAQVAAVRFGPQRLVSLVAEQDAKVAVDGLAAAGVRARVEQESSAALQVTGGLAVGAYVGLSSMSTVVLMPALATLDAVLGLRRDLTTATWLPQSAGAGAGRALVLGLAMVAVGLSFGLPGLVDELLFEGAYALSTAAVLLYAAVGSLVGAPGARRIEGPQLTWAERGDALLQAQRSTASKKARRGKAIEVAPAPKPVAAAKPVTMHPLMTATVVLSLVSLVPLELYGIVSILESVPVERGAVRVEGNALTGPLVIARRGAVGGGRGEPVVVTPVAEPVVEDAPAREGAERPSVGDVPPAISDAPRTASVAPPTARERAQQGVRLAGGLLLPSLALLLIFRHLRRARRIRSDARALEAKLVQGLQHRLVPRRSVAAGGDRAGAVTAPRTRERDTFVDGARQRAAVLTPLLEAGSLDRLDHALTPLRLRPADGEGLLAQCILETDASYSLRFRLLELEGELEAEAAQAWAARIRG